jgi:hypothetical protein
VETGVDSLLSISYPTAIAATSDGKAWVADYGPGSLLFFDADPSLAASIPFPGYAVDLAAEEETSQCWVVDTWEAELVRASPSGVLSRTALPNYPYSVSWSGFDRHVWVGHASGITKYSPQGDPQETYAEPARPYRVSASPWDGSCWAIDGETDTVVKMPAGGGPPTVVGGFDQPSDVSALAADGYCWVADWGAEQAVLLGPDGSREGAWRMPGITGVSACPSSESAWAVCGDGLVRLGRDGEAECVIAGLANGMAAATVP